MNLPVRKKNTRRIIATISAPEKLSDLLNSINTIPSNLIERCGIRYNYRSIEIYITEQESDSAFQQRMDKYNAWLNKQQQKEQIIKAKQIKELEEKLRQLKGEAEENVKKERKSRIQKLSEDLKERKSRLEKVEH